jgi:hypothetical protein
VRARRAAPERERQQPVAAVVQIAIAFNHHAADCRWDPAGCGIPAGAMESTALVVPGFATCRSTALPASISTTRRRPRGRGARRRRHAGTGVTSFLPTLISSDLPRFAACAARAIRAALRNPGCTWRARTSRATTARGAHDPAAMTAACATHRAASGAADGMIRLVTLAPKCPARWTSSIDSSRRGVRVAIGHTAASAETIVEAVRRARRCRRIWATAARPRSRDTQPALGTAGRMRYAPASSRTAIICRRPRCGRVRAPGACGV